MTITRIIPVEIAAVLRAARMAGKGRIVAVVQPHRYTRLQSLFNEFSACLDDADIVVVTPVYSAGEAPIPGIDRDELASGLRRHGHPQRADCRRRGRRWSRLSPRSPNRAIWWSVSAPAPSPIG